MFVPAVDAAEAALIADVDVIPVATLAELAAHLRGDVELQPEPLEDDIVSLGRG